MIASHLSSSSSTLTGALRAWSLLISLLESSIGIFGRINPGLLLIIAAAIGLLEFFASGWAFRTTFL
jgi:hypothetical protein